MQSPTYIAIFKKPTRAVVAAAQHLCSTTEESKHQCTLMLEALINNGGTSIDLVMKTIDNHTGAVPVPAHDGLAETKQLAKMHQAIQTAMSADLANATRDLESKISGITSGVMRKINEMETDFGNEIGILRSAVQSAKTKPVVDEFEVGKAVALAVSNAFAPFKQAVIDAQAQAIVAQAIDAIVIDRKPVREVFGIDLTDAKGNPLMVDLWNAQDAPAIDPNFVWTEGILRHLLLAQRTGENLWFGGHKGTGKSETARQFAAFTGRSFTRINFHKFTTTEDYVGAVGLDNGQTVFKPGDFLSAFTSPSTVILLDEVTNADAGELATLNGFLEPNSAVTCGGAVRRRAPGVLVFAADNTLGSGDESGRYAGTRTMNSSLVDRFARVIRFDYLPLPQEVDAVMRHTGCVKPLAEHILASIRMARAKVDTGDVVDAPSIRSVIAFIRALDVLSVDEAWATTVAARQPSESAAALEAIRKATLNPALIQSLI